MTLSVKLVSDDRKIVDNRPTDGGNGNIKPDFFRF